MGGFVFFALHLSMSQFLCNEHTLRKMAKKNPKIKVKAKKFTLVPFPF